MSTSTPLSDAITALFERDDEPTYEWLVQTFLRSRLGVIAEGLPPSPHGTTFKVGKGDSVTCACIDHPDGRSMLLACADLPVFVTRFDRPFNAELEAATLMNVVMASPTCEGILINSATSENSAVIGRATIERLCASMARKPWWKFW